MKFRIYKDGGSYDEVEGDTLDFQPSANNSPPILLVIRLDSARSREVIAAFPSGWKKVLPVDAGELIEVK